MGTGMIGIGTGARWARGAGLLVVIAIVLLIRAGGASAQILVPVFAGSWSTSYPPSGGTGTLTLKVTDSSVGIAAVSALGGPPSGCSEPTLYYDGAYTTSGGDSGQVAGCTTDLSGLVLAGYYGGGPNGFHGSFSVSISCGDANRFSGTYDELSDGSTGNYAGMRSGRAQACVTDLPAPGTWNQSTEQATLAPGGSVEAPSPLLAPSQKQATVIVPLSQDDAIELVKKYGPRTPGDCIYVALASSTLNAYFGASFAGSIGFVDSLQTCLALLKLRATTRVAAASAGCKVIVAHITIGRRSGRTELDSARDRRPPLIVRCKRGPAGVVVHVRARTGSLRSLVGPRLRVGLYRSRKAHGSAQVAVTFQNH
jgi:hypothetical protein